MVDPWEFTFVGLIILHVSVICSTIIITTKQLTDESGFSQFLSPRIEGVVSDNLCADSSELCNDNNALYLGMVFNWCINRNCSECNEFDVP